VAGYEAKLHRWDPSTDVMTEVPLTGDAKLASSASYWNFIPWNQTCIAANGDGPLLYWDGVRAVEVQACQGTDRVAGKAYLSAVPRPHLMKVYRDKLYVVERQYPRTVQFNENASSLWQNDGTDPAAGAHYWPSSNNFDVGDPGDGVTGWEVLSDRLVIFTRKSIWLYDGESLFEAERGHGCVAPYSVRPAANGIAYLASDGVRLFNGSRSEVVSGPVSPVLDVAARGNLGGAVGVHLPSKKQYRIYLPQTGTKRNRICLVWKYGEGIWNPPWGSTPHWQGIGDVSTGLTSPTDMEVASAIVLPVGADAEILLTGDYSGMVWAEDHGHTDAGMPVKHAGVFKRMGWEGQNVKTFRDILLLCRDTGVGFNYALLADGEEFTNTLGVQIASDTSAPIDASMVTPASEGKPVWDGEPLPGPLSRAVPTWVSVRCPASRKARVGQFVVWGQGQFSMRGFDMVAREDDGGRR
jgi:hypothetical protein